MNNEKINSLINYSYISFMSAIIFLILGFISISKANGDSFSNNSSAVVITDVSYGICLAMLGCVSFIGFILCRIKAIEISNK